MAVDDLWYLKKRGPNDERLPSKRHGRGKRWQVRYVDDGGNECRPLFEKKTDAERFDATMRADVSRGVYIDPTAGKTTVNQYGQTYRETRLHRDNTVVRVEGVLRNHLQEMPLGRMQLRQVRHSHVQAWVRDRSQYLAPSTLQVTFNVLFGLFAAAARDRAIGSNPCLDIDLPLIETSERWIPTPEHVHAAADALSRPALPGKPSMRRYRAQVYVGAGAGLRQGEVWGLELAHVDFLRREIRVEQQLVCPSGKSPYLGPTKTPTSRRTVEMGTVLAEELARHVELYPPAEVEILDATNPRKPSMRLAKLVFVGARGKPLRRSTWTRPWAEAVGSIDGLTGAFTFHDLRHHYASVLIHGGASVKTVQLALGHATPMLTLNTYVGLWPDVIDRTRNLVDAALRRPGAGLAAAR
jgi:site-specific recombinase XerD